MIERNYRLVLLLVVGLVTTLFTAAVGGFDSMEATVARSNVLASSETQSSNIEPVRVVGTPFVLNLRPRER